MSTVELNASATSPAGYLELIRLNAGYRTLWIGEIISLFGDWFNLIASAALVGKLTQSGLAVCGLFVVRMLAPFLVSPLTGVFADRIRLFHPGLGQRGGRRGLGAGSHDGRHPRPAAVDGGPGGRPRSFVDHMDSSNIRYIRPMRG